VQAGGVNATGRVYFFIHVMKTAGGTFRNHLLANFPKEFVYPNWSLDRGQANIEIASLTGLDDDRSETIVAYSGHFPYFATDIVERRIGRPLTRITILRDPVERTLSLLRDMRSWNADTRDRSLEDLYDDPILNPLFVANHQAKVFSLREDDGAESYQHVVEVDDERLALAKERLRRVDFIGVQEQFARFLDTMRSDLGWRIGDAPDRHVSGDEEEVPTDLRNRIAADNRADVELYRFANAVIRERTGRS
jgi:hypothetical protein